MPILGAGFAPAGFSRAGFGSPAAFNGAGTVPLPSPVTGLSQGARLIDAATRQYTFQNGRVQGMNPVAQLVQIAAMTAYNSSAVRGLGVDLSGADVITTSTANQLTAIYQNAFAHLVARSLIKILAIEVTPVRQSGAFVHIRWRDLTTGTEDAIHVGQ